MTPAPPSPPQPPPPAAPTSPPLARRLTAEALGALLLVTVVVGSGIAAQRLSPDDVGLQLLENSTATVFGLTVLILLFGPTSGAHFNPVVSLADWYLGRHTPSGLSLPEVGAYTVAQVAGGIAGAVLANLMYDLPAIEISSTARTGGHLWLGEVVATTGLVALIFTLSRTGRGALAAPAVGAYIGAAYWFTSSTSFANPAVTIGRVFTDTFAGIELAPAFEGPSENEPLLEFQVAHPDVMHRRLTEAGLTDVVVDTAHEELVEVRTGQQLWDWTLGGNPIPGMLVADVSEAQRSAIVRVLDGMVRERADRTGVAVFTAPLNIGLGTS